MSPTTAECRCSCLPYSPIIQRYDTDGDRCLSKDEVAKALDDFFNELITKDQLNEVIAYYNCVCAEEESNLLTAVGVIAGLFLVGKMVRWI